MECRTDRVANNRIQFAHLIVGQVSAVEILHRVANDHRDVSRQLLILFDCFWLTVHGDSSARLPKAGSSFGGRADGTNSS
jgi:hypothetical protein